jgi:hypothetical protein
MSTFVQKALYPNVPMLPGVPQVLRSPLFPTGVPLGIEITAISSAIAASINTAPKWGIFDSSHTQIVVPDSVVDFGYHNEWHVADFQIQEGQFASYNKVATPFEISVRLSKGGTQQDRTAFLNSIQAIAGDLNLYSIVTPEITYTDCNITRWEVIRRGANGAYFLTDVDIYFKQIRFVTAQYSTVQNAQNFSALPTQNTGIVQGTSVSSLFNSSNAAGILP